MSYNTPKTDWQGPTENDQEGDVPGASDFNRIEGNTKDNHDRIDDIEDGTTKAKKAEQADNADKLENQTIDEVINQAVNNIPVLNSDNLFSVNEISKDKNDSAAKFENKSGIFTIELSEGIYDSLNIVIEATTTSSLASIEINQIVIDGKTHNLNLIVELDDYSTGTVRQEKEFKYPVLIKEKMTIKANYALDGGSSKYAEGASCNFIVAATKLSI